MSRELSRAIEKMFGSFTSNPPTKFKGSRMSTRRVGIYNTGISEQAIEDKATEDGQAASLDPEVVGENSHPHAGDHALAGHETATSVIGHDLQDDTLGKFTTLNRMLEEIKRSQAAALESIAKFTSAERRLLVRQHLMQAMGLPRPGWSGLIQFFALLLVVFGGDWALMALGFQVMGLADRPWIPGLAFTDDLHLAALSSVAALVVLGHTVGHHGRKIQHALELRRQAGDQRDDLPMPAMFDYICVIVGFVLALVGVISLSLIRADYLVAIGADANTAAFVGIQLLILGAAIAISFMHSHPEAANWKADQEAATKAEAERDEHVAQHTNTVGGFNGIIDEVRADIVKAGHHVEADGHNTNGQTSAYMRRYILSQPEPAQKTLFKERLKATEFGEGELVARLEGIEAFPVFTKQGTQMVMDALAASLTELAQLAARIDQIEINKLPLPGVDDIFQYEPVDVTADADDVDVDVDVDGNDDDDEIDDQTPATVLPLDGTELESA